MSLGRAARVALRSPPRATVATVRRRWTGARAARRLRARDRRLASYEPLADRRLAWRLPASTLEGATWPRALAEVCDLYLAHRFDLLGSGWVQVRHGMRCAGLEGRRFPPASPVTADAEGRWVRGRVNQANADRAAGTWRLVSAGYEPIDWQLDHKSGFRWSERAWSGDIEYGAVAGADVKVPWELARMQHLPQLALAHAAARAGAPGFRPPEVYEREVRDQILDFVATNPPRFGVNWSCAMDVAIRAANWALACDLLVSSGAGFDEEFERLLAASLVDHGRHVVDFIEWAPDLRANHYLADVVGLIFVAAYLETEESDRWLAFAVEELLAETQLQFGTDGGNFEGSTSYHRLSTEMVLFATAVVAGLAPHRLAGLDAARGWHPPATPARERAHDAPKWSPEGVVPGDEHLGRLARAIRFTDAIARPDGHLPQIGDNDAGRLFKLTPVWCALPAAAASATFRNLDGVDREGETYWYDDGLDHRHLVVAASGLLAGLPEIGDAERQRHGVDARVVAALARRSEPLAAAPGREAPRAGGDRCDVREPRAEIVIELPGPIAQPLVATSFPDFGLHVLRSEAFYLAVRCGPLGQRGFGGHSHNDQLSFELAIDGVDWATDPGTYLYTPLPHERNRYRSAGAHNGPVRDDARAGALDLGLFRLGDEVAAACLAFDAGGLAARLTRAGDVVERRIEIGRASVVIVDSAGSSTPPGRTVVRSPGELDAVWPSPPPSPSYGWVVRDDARHRWRALVRGAVAV